MARLAAAILVIATPGLALAQLPGLSKLVGGGDGGTPKLRLAGSDALAEEASGLAGRLTEQLAKRRPEIEKARADVAAELHDLAAAVPPAVTPDGGTAPASGRRGTLQALDAALAHELDTLGEARDGARRALATLGNGVGSPGPVHDLDAVVALERAARTAQTEAAAAQSAIPEGSLDLDGTGPAPPGADPATRLAAERSRVDAAESALARARALEARAQARRLRARADAWWAAVRITPETVRAAYAELEAAERKLATVTAHASTHLGNADGGEPEGSLEDIEARRAQARIQAAEAAVARARVRLATARALQHPAEGLSSDLSVAPLAARAAALAQARGDAESLSATLRASLTTEKGRVRRAVEQRLHVLDETLSQLKQATRDLADARILASLVRARLSARPHRPAWLDVLLTLLVALVALLILGYGQKLVHEVTAPEGAVGKRLGLSPTGAAKLDILAVLVLAVVVIGTAAAVVVWAVWGSDVTLAEALGKLDAPLFLVDDRPVSFVSMLKLVAAIVAAVAVSRAVRRFLSKRLWPAFAWDTGLTNALNTLTHYLVLAAGFFLGLRFVGIGLSSLALVASVLGIGIGFGLRNIAENFISGLIILAERPIKIGDYIDIDGQLEGQVRQIRARSTTVVTRDNISVIIPNSAFVGGRVTNWSHGDPRVRLRILVGVAYGSETDLVRKALLGVAERHGKVLKRPTAEVQFTGFGDSSLDFELLVWIDDQQERFRIMSDLHFAIDAAFRRVGIEISFPQVDVHMKTVEPQVSSAIERIVRPEPPPGDDGGPSTGV